MTKRTPPERDFRPFADAAMVQTFGDLSFENGADRIAIQGSSEITRDRDGLVRAKALEAALRAIVAVLEAEDLPKSITDETRHATLTKNPFT